jgi:5-methylcytosine-specific restriction endonuclease McrA
MPIIRSGYAQRTTGQQRGHHRKHWRTIRLQRLALDGHRCTIRLPGCTTTATSVHLHPALGNNHDLATLSNTQSACAHCHGRIDGAGRRK